MLFSAKASCPSLSCEYKCQASLTGGACYCPEGRALAPDNRTCIDRDECTEWGFCDQLCTNSDGGYTCDCSEGYMLIDNKQCSAANSSELLLYFAHEKAVVQMNRHGDEVKIITNTTGASGLDYHYTRNILFWSDTKTRKVHSQPLRGTPMPFFPHMQTSDITLPGTWHPVALAVDWVGDKLYVADAIGQKIDVFELDGRWHAIVLGSNLTNPSDIALDPLVGYMFVADSSQVSLIALPDLF